MTFTLRAGLLQQLDTGGDTPARQRLYNLGFGRGDFRKWDDPTFKRNVAAFKKRNGLSDPLGPDDGTLDDPTRAKLKQLHGS